MSAPHRKISKHLKAAQEQLELLSANLIKARKQDEELTKLPTLPWPDDDEVKTFLSQSKFVIARRVRENEFSSAMQRFRDEFEKSEQVHERLLAAQISKEIMTNDVDLARQHMVPAYVFYKFLQLPVELQRRIWSFAARCSWPETIFFASRPDVQWREGHRGVLGVSWQIESEWHSSYLYARHPYSHDYPENYHTNRQTPSLLHACHLSPNLAMDVFRTY